MDLDDRSLAALVTALGLALSLAACGGGGGGDNNPAISSPLPDAARVRALTGSQPPAETAADQSARAAGIVTRADSLIASTMFMETSDPDLPTFQFRASCSGTRCTFRESTTGVSRSTSLDDLGFRPGDSRTVLTKNGITTREGRDAERESYGAWMQHAFFEVASGQSVTEEGVRFAGWFGRALGDLTDARPDVTAQWHGLMVGTPSRGALRGTTLQGDAALTYTLTGNSLDAAFTDIKNLDTGAAHSTSTLRFDDVPVATDGTYEAGLTGNRIRGGFYGSDHVEAAGIFERSGIVGAFGAKREATPTAPSETPTVPDWLWLPSADGARSRIGGEPLDLTSQQIIDRAGRLLQAASLRLIREEFTNTGARDVDCNGLVCRWGGYGGNEDRLALEVGGEWRPVMRHRGVDLAQGRGRVTGENAHAWGEYLGIMEHGGFGLVRLDRDTPSGSWSAFPYAFGNAPGTNPGADLGTAAWNGVMMGFDTSGAAPGTIQGDAAITVDLGEYSFSSATVDVAFTNVRNLGTGAAARDMRWNDMRLRDGGFEDGYILGDSYIKGAFFGPQHQEVGGVFKQDLYTGAFGAKR